MAGAGLAESAALIVIGLTGSESDSENFAKLSAEIREGLRARGIAAERITLLDEKVTRESALAALASAAKPAGKGDELWLVLLGHGGITRGDMPAFQVRGQRLTAEDLQKALKDIPAAKMVFVATNQSGAFLPYLDLPDCVALAATAEKGEVNQPRFPAHWAAALSKDPRASMAVLAARAAEATKLDFESSGLARAEHARLRDSVSGKILGEPFGVADLAAAASSSAPGGGAQSVTTDEIVIPKPSSDDDFQTLPPTDETGRMIAEAKALPNPDDYPALLLRQALGYVLNADHSTVERHRLRVYLARDDAADAWANYQFYQQPPVSLTVVEAARIILPDGSSVVLNPTKLPGGAPAQPDGMPFATQVFFPQAAAGAIVEIAWRVEERPQVALPEFYDEIQLQHAIPALATELTLKLPKMEAVHTRLHNLSAQADESETGHSRVSTWQFGPLPAYEPLPLDPPRRDLTAWVGVSAFDGWEGFIAWYRRTAAGTDTITEPIRAKAKEIAAREPGREGRVREAFEFVSSLRYVAIEFGIHAFRPRPPEQVLRQRYGDCKDKANLLIALLRAMDIPADFVLINRGSSTDPDFAGWQFNHAIAHVPPGQGQPAPLWLDSTDTTTPFGSVAPGNVGRSALVFEKERAEFQTVSAGSATVIEDRWELKVTGAGGLAGTVRQSLTGLADYTLRTQLRSLSPAQRTFYVTRALAGMLPGADFTEVNTSDPGDLNAPMRIDARVASATQRLPAPGLDFLADFAPLTRDRPAIINDNQPLRYSQVVALEGALIAVTREEAKAAGCSVFIVAEEAEGRSTRSASCDIAAPAIAVADYAAFRAMLNQWTARLALP